ncbi:MAG: peptidylprolyl isomerase [Clostridia bacterium]|nr:peptidylprolyl isomerase [Clostridia bacterium]
MRKTAFVRIISCLLCILTALGLFTSCSKESYRLGEDGTPIIEPSEDDLKVVMTIGGYEITYDIYRYFFLNYKAQYDQGNESVWNDPEVGEALRAAHKETVLESIKGVVAMQKLAEKAKLNLESDVIKNAVTSSVLEMYAYTGNDIAKYKEELASQNLTDRAYRYMTGVSELQSRSYLLSGDNGIVDLSEAAVMAANLDENEFACVKQILIRNDEGEDKEENLRRAQYALSRIEKGESFEVVMSDMGEDKDLKNQSDGYYFTHYEYLEEFEKATFALDIGEVSCIVETEVGYSIIKRYPKSSEYIERHYSDLKNSYSLASYYRAEDEVMAALPEPVFGDIYTLLTIENVK